MKINRRILIILFVMISITTNSYAVENENDNAAFVRPFIGTDGHGHTFPGAAVPFGMVQLSPDTGTEGWDWCSGYHYSDNSIMGFSHTHISGTGVGDLGDILVMPLVGDVKTISGSKENPDDGYRSRFSHGTETAVPGYYSVLLDDYNIRAELTVTERVGFHKYTFPKTDQAHILFDLVHSVYNREVIYSSIRIEDNTLITGCRRVNGWAKNRHIYFAAQFSQPFKSYGLERNGEIVLNYPEDAAKSLKAFFDFDTKENNVIYVKVGLSAVSTEAALKNLLSEVPEWDFDKVKNNAYRKWNTELGRIMVDAGENTKQVFYTALYHSMLIPELHMDSDGTYRGLDQNIHKADGFTNYTVFSLWDTFRALHPLLTILKPDMVNDLINSMLAHYDQNAHHILPVWSLCHNETWCMIGYHAVPVIVDAYLKGIRGYDTDRAWEAVFASATRGQYAGLEHYIKYGYVPIDLEKEAASKTLEYAYDDWCVAQFAKSLGKEPEYKEFIKRSSYYQNIFDPVTGFMRAKKSDGSWKEPFDPFFAQYGGDFTEGNSWQYSWFAPQDVYGFIELMGGHKKFVKKLDRLFTVRPLKNEDAPMDITGLIGQYAHGNEPSHHVAYLYTFAGQSWKTQEKTHQIMTELYNNTPDGICGNEDCGQMSAWYVFSAMGMYPVNPSNSVYVFGAPVLRRARIKLDNGKEFVIRAENLSAVNKYVRAVTLNGKEYNKTWISHKDIMNGGELVFQMGAKANKKLGTAKQSLPPVAAF